MSINEMYGENSEVLYHKYLKPYNSSMDYGGNCGACGVCHYSLIVLQLNTNLAISVTYCTQVISLYVTHICVPA